MLPTPGPSSWPDPKDLDYSISVTPKFGFAITRLSDGAVIFNTTSANSQTGLAFADQVRAAVPASSAARRAAAVPGNLHTTAHRAVHLWARGARVAAEVAQLPDRPLLHVRRAARGPLAPLRALQRADVMHPADCGRATMAHPSTPTCTAVIPSTWRCATVRVPPVSRTLARTHARFLCRKDPWSVPEEQQRNGRGGHGSPWLASADLALRFLPTMAALPRSRTASSAAC